MKRAKTGLLLLLCLLAGCSLVPEEQISSTQQYREEIEQMEEPELYYYEQLDAQEKEIYKTLSVCLQNDRSSITFDGVATAVFTKAYMAFSYDHPEYYWLSEFSMSMQEDLVIGVLLEEEDHSEMTARLEQKAEEIVSQIPEEYTTYQKVKYLYDTVIDMTVYQEDSKYNQDIRSVLLYGESVCAGYAKTFQYLCNKANIEAACVSGIDSKEESHMWNMVWIDGESYWIDATWDDSNLGGEHEGDYHHFCLTDEELFVTRTIDASVAFGEYAVEESFKFPKCTDDSYNYYKQKGCYFEDYSQDIVGAYLNGKMAEGQYDGIDLKFRSEADYQEACRELFGQDGEEGKLLSLVQDELADQGWREVNVTYTYYDSINYMVIDLELQ